MVGESRKEIVVSRSSQVTNMRIKKFTQAGCRRNKTELQTRMFDIYIFVSVVKGWMMVMMEGENLSFMSDIKRGSKCILEMHWETDWSPNSKFRSNCTK